MAQKKEIALVKLIEPSSNEEQCRAYLEGLRWPEGVTCPRCGSEKISRIKTRGQLDCDSCRYRFSVTAGTIFHNTHLPLWKWLVTVYFIVGAKKTISADRLKDYIGVSYKTAWYLRRRIRTALAEVDAKLSLGGVDLHGASPGVHDGCLDASLNEMRLRMSNKGNPYALRDAVRKLLVADNLTYSK